MNLRFLLFALSAIILVLAPADLRGRPRDLGQPAQPCGDSVVTEHAHGDTLFAVGACEEDDGPLSGSRSCESWVQKTGWTYGMVHTFYANQYVQIPEITWGASDCNDDGIPWCKGSVLGLGGVPLPDSDLDWLWTGSSRATLSPPDEKSLSLWTYDLEVGSEYSFLVSSNTSRGSYSLPGGSVGITIRSACGPIRIAAFPLELLQVEKIGGTGRVVDLAWAPPDSAGCSVDHFAILRWENAIADTNYLEACVVEAALPGTSTTFVDTTNLGHLGSHYAVAGFNAAGRFVALSSSEQATPQPGAFSLIAPSDESVLEGQPIELRWQSVYAKQFYDLVVSEDPGFSNPTVFTGLQDTMYMLGEPLTDHAHYYWRVCAYEAIFPDTVWSRETAWRFGVNTANVPPDTFSLLSPAPGESVDALRPKLTWTPASDSGDYVLYTLELAYDAAFDSVDVYDGLTHPYFYPPSDLPRDTLYWRVTGYDSHGDSVSNSGGVREFTVAVGGPPFRFVKIAPQRRPISVSDGLTIAEEGAQPTFEWHPSYDPDGGSVTYEIWVDTNAAMETAEVYDGIADTTWTYAGSLAENHEYFWDVYAIDTTGEKSKSYGRVWAFDVNETHEPPDTFEAISPAGLHLDVDVIPFLWDEPTDPDPNDVLSCDLWLSPDSTFVCKRKFEYLPYGTDWTYHHTYEWHWAPTDFAAYDGNSWWCGNPDSLGYDDQWFQALRSGSVDLSGCSGPVTLSFKHSYETEGPNWDGGAVRISADNWGTWDVLTPSVGAYDADSLYAFTFHCNWSVPGYCGSSGGWVDAEFDLSPYCGQVVQVDFVFASDGFIHGFEGWHIDDVMIVADGDTLLSDDGGDSSVMLECVPLIMMRGQPYYWKLKANDLNSPEHATTDWAFSQVQTFQLSPYQAVSGVARLQGQGDHSGIKVTLMPRSPLAVADSTYTNGAGAYAIAQASPGTYAVRLSYPGYEDVELPEFSFFSDDVMLEETTLVAGHVPPADLVAHAWDGLVTLTWATPDWRSEVPLTAIHLFRSQLSGGPYGLLEVMAPDAVAHSDTTVANDSTYYYVASAIYHGTYESAYSDESTATPHYSGPVCHVSPDGSDVLGDGTSGNPYETIQQGIRTVRDADTVLVNPGNYAERIDFIGRDIVVGSLLLSTGDSTYVRQTIVDGGGEGSVVTIASGEDSTAMLVGLTIAGGNADSGGGVYVEGASPRIDRCHIEFNSADIGGGVYAAAGASPSLVSCVLSLNSSLVSGGGFAAADSSSASLINVTFVGNSASSGEGDGLAALGYSYVELTQSILSLGQSGTPTVCDSSALLSVSQTCVYGNAGGDSLSGSYSDNIFVNPVFCDPEAFDYTVHEYSPCLPPHNGWGVRLGALGVGCYETGPPSIPDSIWAQPGYGVGSIVVDWSSIPELDVSHYRLERDTTTVFGASADTVIVANTHYEDTDLPTGQEYCYRVFAVDLAGNSSAPSDTVCSLSQDIDEAPAVPCSLAVVQGVGDGTIHLSWVANPEDDLDYYEIQRDTTSAFGGTLEVITTQDTTYVDAVPVPGREYCYRLFAVDLAGQRSAPSDTLACSAVLATVYVDAGYLGFEDGTPEHPFDTIAEALLAAASPGSVLVYPGTYTGESNRDLDFQGKLVWLKGTAGADSTVIDCEGLGRAFYFHSREDTTAGVEGVTIQNGYSPLDGGGIYIRSWTNPKFVDVVFSGCEARRGGAVYCYMGSGPVFVRTAFYGNEAVRTGGAVGCRADSNPPARFRECEFSGNSAGEQGGAAWFWQTFCANFYGCLFVSNSAGERGGGIYCSSNCILLVKRSTFFENSALEAGGGCWTENSVVEIYVSIIAFSASGEGFACANTVGYPTEIRANCIHGNAGGDSLTACTPEFSDIRDNTFEHPLFCDSAAGDFSLQTGSPCLSENSPWNIDMGAFGEGCGDAPPDAPRGLDAQPVGAGEEVLLSWRPNTEPDLHYYLVNRDTSQFFGSGTLIAGTQDTQFVDVAPPPGIECFYRAFAVDVMGGMSTPSDTVSCTPVDLPPSGPSGLAADATDQEGEIALAWEPNPELDLDYYRVERDTTLLFGVGAASFTTSDTVYVDSDLMPWLEYSYRLFAVDMGGHESEPSDTVSCTPLDLPPSVPVGLAVVPGVDEGEILVSWSANVEMDLDHYLVERDTTALFGVGTLASTTQDTVYADSDLALGVEYYYRLFAVDVGGHPSAPSDTVSCMSQDQPPSAPLNVVAEPSGEEGTILLSWSPSPEGDLDHYSVERDTTVLFGLGTMVFTTMDTLYLDTDLVPILEYFYRLFAVDQGGHVSAPSDTVSSLPGWTGIDDPLPTTYSTSHNFPNPFNPTTRIVYEVPAPGGSIALRIYDPSGRLIRTLVDESVPPGRHTAVWDGRDGWGREVAAGVYFYVLEAPDFRERRKMVFLK